MQLPAPAAWAWIPIVIGAALAQTVRNAAQRTISSTLGAWSATLVRFLYGLPFAILWLGCVYLLDPDHRSVPDFNWAFGAWLMGGAMSQILATFFLLSAMAQRNFIVGVTFSKT
ncbi:MAG: EamA/RhaT family transporter, partial [Betaproteobacteria bacterium]